MTIRKATVLVLLILALPLASCNSRTDRSEGSVILTVNNFDGLPTTVSAASGPFVVGTLNLQNIAKDPSGTTSDLQTIEMRSYEVVFTRRDTGRRVPPTLVGALFGNLTVGGQLTLTNLPFMMSDQTQNSPLVDLAENGSDPETGTSVIVLDVTMRFFGRTLAGDNIASAPASFTIEVTP
jgi:hypothetical protein